jgi:hypothetical protein
MKTTTLFSILVYALLMLSSASCTKENIMMDTPLMTEQNPETYQKALAGSWQFVDEGVEVNMYNGQSCSFTGTKNPMIQWSNVSADEKRAFTADGKYSRYVNGTLTYQGTYAISYDGVLELTTNAQKSVETIQELTCTSLILREGMLFRKYSKLE